MKVTINHSYELTNQDIDDIMVTALEGAINYWCGAAHILSVPKKYIDEVKYASDVISIGGQLLLTDVEDPSEQWVLDKKKFVKGFKKHCEERGANPEDMVEGHDATDADCIIQYALFNEIVFG